MATESDDLTGRPILHPPGEWSPQWAASFMRGERANCRARGECVYCGETNGQHELGCRNAPDEGEEE